MRQSFCHCETDLYQVLLICTYNRRRIYRIAVICIVVLFNHYNYNSIKILWTWTIIIILFWYEPEQTRHCSWGSRKGFHAHGNSLPARIQPDNENHDVDEDESRMMMRMRMRMKQMTTTTMIVMMLMMLMAIMTRMMMMILHLEALPSFFFIN